MSVAPNAPAAHEEKVSPSERKAWRQVTVSITGLFVLTAVALLLYHFEHNRPGKKGIPVPVSDDLRRQSTPERQVEVVKTAAAASSRMIQAPPAKPLESLLPAGAKIIEKVDLAAVPGKHRSFVLWMLSPSDVSRGQNCAASVYGDFWSGPTRLSLIDPTVPSLINTVNITSDADDRFSIPYWVADRGAYYVPHPTDRRTDAAGNTEADGSPQILRLKDFTGSGIAAESSLFAYQACGIVSSGVFGYQQSPTKVVKYPIEVHDAGGTHMQEWVAKVFSIDPVRPGHWNFTWAMGHGSDAKLHEEVSFDPSRQMFVESETSIEPGPLVFNKPLLSGEVAISPQQVRYWQFAIDPSMINVHVVGSFHASGGSGDDIEATIAEKGQCENWIKGHQAQVLYASGKVTNADVDVPIQQAGVYRLAFSNRMALLSTKTVAGAITLQYYVPQR